LAFRKAGDHLAEAVRTQLAEAYLQEMRARKAPMIVDWDEYWQRNNIPESEQDWSVPSFDARNLEAAIEQEGAASLSPSELRLALNRVAEETSIDPYSKNWRHPLSGPEKLHLIAEYLNDSGSGGHNYGIYPVQDPRGTYGATVFNYDRHPEHPELLVPNRSGSSDPTVASFTPVPGGKFTHYFEEDREWEQKPIIHHATLSTPTARQIYQGLVQGEGAVKRSRETAGDIAEMVDNIWRVENADEVRNQLGPIARRVLSGS